MATKSEDQQTESMRQLLKEVLTAYSREERAYLDQRFVEERKTTRSIVHDQSIDDRAYLIGYFQEQFVELRSMIQKLDTREDNDAKDSVSEIELVKKQLAELEAAFKQFVAAHQS